MAERVLRGESAAFEISREKQLIVRTGRFALIFARNADDQVYYTEDSTGNNVSITEVWDRYSGLTRERPMIKLASGEFCSGIVLDNDDRVRVGRKGGIEVFGTDGLPDPEKIYPIPDMVWVKDTSISRVHAEVAVGADIIRVSDLNSTNGTGVTPMQDWRLA